MDKLKKLDLFPKVNDDFYQRTSSGGVITIGASLIMAALFFSELGKPASAAMCWSSAWAKLASLDTAIPLCS